MASKWLRDRKARLRSRWLAECGSNVDSDDDLWNFDATSHGVVLSAGTRMAASPLDAMEAELPRKLERPSPKVERLPPKQERPSPKVERLPSKPEQVPSKPRHMDAMIEEESDDDDLFGLDSLAPSRRGSLLGNTSGASSPYSPLRSHRRSSVLASATAFLESRRKAAELRRSSGVVSRGRGSRVQARRKDLLDLGLGPPEGASSNPVAAGGFLHDFVARCRSRPLFAYDVGARRLDELCRREQFLEHAPKDKHAGAVAVMLKEALICFVTRLITPELKERGPERCGFAPARKGRLWEIARIAVRNKRAAKCLEAEVKSMKKRFGLARRSSAASEAPRSKFQKLEKAVGLWLDFHGRAWTVDEAIIPPRKPPSRGGLASANSLPSFTSADAFALDAFGPAATGKMQLPPLASRPPSLPSRPPTGDSALPPSKPKGGGGRLPAVASRVKYLGACEGRFTPTPLAFVTGHASGLEAAGRNLLDHDLLAMAGALPAGPIDSVNFCGCKSLTDKSLVPFLKALLKSQAKRTLRKLILRQCVRAAVGTQGMVVELLHAIDGLRHLDLSSVQISTQSQWPLCEAIRDHAYLETAILSGIGLGHSPQTKDCIAALGTSKLKTMDIGWNSFSMDEFQCFAERLRDNECLSSLSLPNSSSKKDGSGSAISFFLEHLAHMKTLRHLDVSMNGIDYQSALVLEDVLERHRQLTQIDLSGNNLGSLGMRSLLRLMSQSHSALTHFDLTEAWHGMGPTGDKVFIFRYTNPSGRYDFDLARPYHRSFLRMLYKACERFSITPEQAFQGITYSNGGYKHPPKDDQGMRLVPTQGTLSFTFTIERGIEWETQGVQDEDFGGFLQKHYASSRLNIAFHKSALVVACLRELSGMESVQANFLRALSVDFNLTLPQLEVLCEKCKAHSDEIVSTLFPCLPVDSLQRLFAHSILPNCERYLESEPRTRQLLDLNVENPTGHYNLDLGSGCDFAAAQHLLLLDRWEVLVDGRRRRCDVSSRGTRSHLRNERYRSKPLLPVYESISEWNLPEVDWFEFDYTSSVRPPPGAEVLGDRAFDVMLAELADCTAPPAFKLSALRTLSSHFYVTAMQLRLLLGMFRTQEEKADALVIFFARIVDMCNAKVFLVRFGSSEEKLRLQKRLGYAAFFPFVQPENERFSLDLSFHDQRVCCMLLVTLSLHEKAENIRGPRYVQANGTVDTMSQGVPRIWEAIEKVPAAGVFSASYVCAPDDRQFDVRKKLGQTYGYFKTTAQQQQVLWWTGLSEPPRDVIVFLDFLLQKTSDPDEAFTLVDVKGTGSVTLRTLADAIDAMGCTEFDGEDKYDRIQVIFRFLDPGAQGSITAAEWEVIKQLWSDLEHTVSEFAQFLIRLFGEDLTESWEALHEELGVDDVDTPLSLAQLTEASEGLGYYGPLDVVFRTLDQDRDSLVSEDEFQLLGSHRTSPSATGRASARGPGPDSEALEFAG